MVLDGIEDFADEQSVLERKKGKDTSNNKAGSGIKTITSSAGQSNLPNMAGYYAQP